MLSHRPRSRWPSWLPRLHLEIVQRRSYEGPANAQGGANTLTTQEELMHLRELFPQTSLRATLT